MTITAGQLIAASDTGALRALYSAKICGARSFRILRLIVAIRPPADLAISARMGLFTPENSTMTVTATGKTMNVKPECEKEFQSRLAELHSQEIELEEALLLSHRDLDQVELSANQYESLLPFIAKEGD
jgi:hypothetical protein